MGVVIGFALLLLLFELKLAKLFFDDLKADAPFCDALLERDLDDRDSFDNFDDIEFPDDDRL